MNYECQAFVKHVKDVRLLLLVGYKRQVWSYKSMKVLRPQFYCPAHVVYPPAVKLIKKKNRVSLCHLNSAVILNLILNKNLYQFLQKVFVMLIML